MPSVEELLETKQQRIDQLHRCVAGRTALIVVDMQHGFLDPGASLEVPKGRAIVPNLRRLLEAFRTTGSPVIYTEFVYAEAIPCLRGDPFGPEHLPVAREGPGFGLPSSNCLIGPQAGRDAESAGTVEALAPRPEELVVQAHTYDKFYGTHLDLALRSHGVERVVMTGITTDVCVNSTVLSAATRNYRVTVVSDGVATIHDEIQEACFRIWENKFARVRTADQVLEEMAASG